MSTVESHYNESWGHREEFFVVPEIANNQLHFHSRILTGLHEFIQCTVRDFFITSFNCD